MRYFRGRGGRIEPTDPFDLFEAFMDRRYDRVRAVVEASMQLCAWQLDHVRDADVPGLIGRISQMLTELP